MGALGFVAAAAAGYVVARQFMDHGELIERLPEPARSPLEAVRSRLLVARQRAATVIGEAKRERARAEAELMDDYYRRVGRPQPAAPGDDPQRPRREPVWRPNEPFRDRPIGGSR